MDISQDDIQRVISEVMRQMSAGAGSERGMAVPAMSCTGVQPVFGNEENNREETAKTTGKMPVSHMGETPMPRLTPARVLIGRTGTRYPTAPYLEFLLAHAAARDAVLGEVSAEAIERMGLLAVQSTAKTKDEFVANAELGRRLSEPAKAQIAAKCPKGATMQIIVADGLSSTAIETNAAPLLAGLAELAKRNSWSMGQGVFIRHGRLGATNEIGELLSPEVAVTIVGERPGLVTSENVGAYVTYRPGKATTEAQRNLVSNIHSGGTTVSQAVEKLTDLLTRVLAQKTSGVGLK